MLHTFQHLILWGKFRSLNKRYNGLIEQAKHDRDTAIPQHVEETFWYETAILLEQRRRLHVPQSPPPSRHSRLPAPPVYPKILVAREHQAHPPYLFTQQPPSSLFLIVFTLLGGMSLTTGLLWLVFP